MRKLSILYEWDSQLCTFLAHGFGPDARLDFANMRLAEIEHAKARLSNTATDAQRERALYEATMEVEFEAVLLAALLELVQKGFLVHSDAHRTELYGAVEHIVPHEEVAIQSEISAIGGKRRIVVVVGRSHIVGLLRQTIRPEFLNRIDDIILFHPLSETDIQQIVRLQASMICKRLSLQSVQLEVYQSAVNLVAQEGFDPTLGARPVKYALQRPLLDRLSHALLADTISKDKPIIVKATGKELTFEQSAS